jgi:hypothetical protein
MIDAEVRFATCRVQCGKDTGTGWLVSQDKVITARHCIIDAIDEDAEISLVFEYQGVSKGVTANIIDHNSDLDICLLSIESISDITPITLNDSLPIEGSQFYSYGYPVSKLAIGHRLEGAVSKVLDIPKLSMDINLHIESSAVLTEYEGLSGAALICDGVCLGVIRIAVDNTVGAISTASMGDFLREHGVLLDEGSEKEQATQNLAPREEFTQEFDALVRTQSGGYAFIEGAHGIGKSVFCENYAPTDSSLEHFDTYSFSAGREDTNVTQLAQPQEFYNWLSMQVSVFLTKNPGRLDKKHYSELIKEVEGLLVRLGEEYTAQDQIGVLFIDGLDEIEKLGGEALEKFIGLLPQTAPTGLAIVLSAPNYSRLARRLGTRLGYDNCLSIPALTSSASRRICRKGLLESRYTPTTVQLICDRAQGHPLYLRYLIDLANSGADDTELAALPLIKGSIRNYYDVLWNQLQEDADAINLLAIAVRLRWGISIQQFTGILNQAEQIVLVSTITRIQHLLLTPEETTIYHSSFSDFLIEKTSLRESDVQHRLAQYCEGRRNTHYGLLNIIHHGLKSDNIEKSHVVSLCDQDWVDDCVIEGIKPDILLGDVNKVLSAAIELGSLTETVRILLLSQRVQFRYDTLFAQSANLIANALISLGKTQEALQHVIRYERLIIPIPDALKVALKLTEYDEHKDAIGLLNIIETLIEEQFSFTRSGNGITYENFLNLYDLQQQQFLIRVLAGDPNASRELTAFQLFWNESIKSNVSDETESKLIRSEMMKCLQANTMCFIGRYMSVDQICQIYTGAVDKLVEPLVYATSYYQRLCDYFDVLPDQNLLGNVFSDLQNLVSEGWDGSKEISLNAVDSLVSLGISGSSAKAIIGESSETLSPVQFVAENNVSMDESLLHQGMIQWRYASLINPELPCPNLVKLSSSGWQDGIDSICRIMAWCDGSARRFKESDNISGLEEVWSLLQSNVFDQLKFNLADRVSWEDAYALPEEVIPQIYRYLTDLITASYPDRLGCFVSFIEDQFNSQCGVYSEGFRQVLAIVLNYTTRIQLDDEIEDQLFSLTERWRDFVVVNLKNRHELVPELLTIVPLFVRLNAPEEAQRTYQSVLGFSMGPTWYKEDQFGLMTTALESSSPELIVESGVLSQIAGLLDEASGEMTFQRFVRYAKNDLIGALCERGDFTNAVNYFIRQTYGTSEQLYEEATQASIDRVSQLRGSRFPGNALDEQASIINIVKPAIPLGDWPLCWAVLEIFQFGDSRHQSNYAEAYALLMQEAQQDQDAIAEMMRRLELICESEIESEQRSDFLLSVQKHLPVELKDQFEKLFEVHPSISETEFPQVLSETVDDKKENSTEEQQLRDEFLMPGTFGTQTSIQVAEGAFSEAERKLRRRNKLEAQEKIIAGLKSIQDGHWSIWGGQIEEVSKGQKLLLEATDSLSDVVKLCFPIILNERYAERWRIANSLVEWLVSSDDHDKQIALIKLTIEHIEIMVGSIENHIQSYDFLEESSDTEASCKLIKLILHAIDHPTWLRSEKAADILLWLLRKHSKYIPMFGSKAFSMEDSVHPDVICGVLDQLSQSNAEQLWDQLVPALDLEGIQQNCKHVGRVSVLIRIASRAAQRGSDSASQGLTVLKENIFDITDISSNITQASEIECPTWAESIGFQWSQLTKLGLVNSELVERVTTVMQEQCSPLTIETSLELEQLLAEGARGNASRPERWKAKLCFAFQVALLPITTKALLPQIERIFRHYNPSRLDKLRILRFSSPTVGWLTQLKNSSFAVKPIRGKHIYLDFYERVWLEGNWRHLRLTAYFYETGKHPQPTLPSGRFFSTEKPTSTNISSWDTCSNVKGLPVYFGSFIPAIPSPTLMQVTSASTSDISRAYWRSGRVSINRGGGPEHEGCYLAMNIDSLRLPRGLEMAWVYEVDGEFHGMVTPR